VLIPKSQVVPLYLFFVEEDQESDEEEPKASINQEQDIEVGYAADSRLLHHHTLTILKSQSSEYKSDSDDDEEEEEEEEEEEKPQLQYRPVFIPKCVIFPLFLSCQWGLEIAYE
jgi:hypothetical protein